MHYQPMTEENKKDILREAGVSSFQELIKAIPASLTNPQVRIDASLSEIEVQVLMQQIGQQNRVPGEYLSFLGGGSYEHFIPAAVAQVIGRQEFYTAYTPYQPEAAQGTLQAIFEYQSLMTELTDLDVSNASHYDGATSMAEAALLAHKHTGKNRILIARSTHPHYRQVLKTYLSASPVEIVEFGFGDQFQFDPQAFEKLLDQNTAAVIFQTPNFFGVLENLTGVAEKVHALGALLILSSHPLSLGIFRTPGEWGADIAVGEGQPLGIPPAYGGPYLGYFVTNKALMRKIPGRLAGLTLDSEGKRTYCLTLQAREQHIRRERAASNICTNQALCALAACVYMTLLGKQGLREVAELNLDRAQYLRAEISKLKNYTVDLKAPVFNEFVVKSRQDFTVMNENLLKRKIFPGVDLSSFYPELKNQFLVCATETKTKEQIQYFVEALSQC